MHVTGVSDHGIQGDCMIVAHTALYVKKIIACMCLLLEYTSEFIGKYTYDIQCNCDGMLRWQ